MEKLLLVNPDGMLNGLTASKIDCHKGDGLLHKAFLVTVYDNHERLLLTRRSPNKELWAGYWDGSVASHVLERDLDGSPKQGYINAARRRIPQELGISLKDLIYMDEFLYKAIDPNKKASDEVRVEYEICAVIFAYYSTELGDINPNTEEISDIRWVTRKSLLNAVDNTSRNPYTPWFRYSLLLNEILRYQNAKIEGRCFDFTHLTP